MQIWIIIIGLIGILFLPISLELFAKYILGLGNPPLMTEHKTIEYEYLPNQDLRRFHRRIKINSMGMRSEELSRLRLVSSSSEPTARSAFLRALIILFMTITLGLFCPIVMDRTRQDRTCV